MNFSTLEWCEGPRAPVPLEEMQTAVVQGTCYFMGGYSEGECIDLEGIHSMSLPALIGYFTSEDPRTKRAFKRHIWNKIPGLPFTLSSPLGVGGSLLALGGDFMTANNCDDAVNDILLYQPEKLEWTKIGQLPSRRNSCACAMISERKLIVAGGEDFNLNWTPATYLAEFAILCYEHIVVMYIILYVIYQST